jgi:hypothetical protein
MSDTPKKWEYRGIEGWGEMPRHVASEIGTAVVLAGAACVWEDIRKLPAHSGVIAVNDVGAYYRHKVNHWVSYHDRCLMPLREVRRSRQRNDPMLHAHFLEDANGTDVQKDVFYWNLTYQYSTSGILAVLIGLALGYDRLILAGMPADNTPDFWQDPSVWNSQGTKVRHKLWGIVIDRLPDVQKRVRSMSGYTRKWLGAPDDKWLKEK